MSSVLLCASPIYGHVAPMLVIGRHLVESGHRVRMLTGRRFADAVTAAGIEHLPLPEGADYDDRDLSSAFPAAENMTGVKRLRFDVEHLFVRAMPAQYHGVRAAMSDAEVDVVLAETAFTGVLPLLLETEGTRPPVLICGVVPLAVSSKDTAPFGLGLQPSTTVVGRFRNRALNLLVSKVIFRSAQRLAQQLLDDLGVARMPCFVLDGASLADGILQLTGPGFEYPRSDLKAPLELVGPVLPAAASFEKPDWWGDLDAARPVVHVTQGTVANGDLEALLLPTVRALADRDVLVVATTGDEVTAEMLRASVPPNTRVAAFVPYDELLPKVDAMVTNGGYGGVQFALAHGVPLVVAGDTEEKPEIAARVAWSGVGISLHTGRPSQDVVAQAVDKVLSEPGYRARAAQMRAELATCTPLESIEAAVRAAVAAQSVRT
jgi:MGT family glycosyltransferase